jgi:hypothetical protein
MGMPPVAHMFERFENCHKLSQLAPNSRSNTLAAAIRRLPGMRSIPGKVPGRVARVRVVRPGGQIASIVDPTISTC